MVVLVTLLRVFHKKASKTRDITGGLPRVADLFEARKTKRAVNFGGNLWYCFLR